MVFDSDSGVKHQWVSPVVGKCSNHTVHNHANVHVQKHAQKHLSPQTKHLNVVGYLIGKFLHVK